MSSRQAHQGSKDRSASGSYLSSAKLEKSKFDNYRDIDRKNAERDERRERRAREAEKSHLDNTKFIEHIEGKETTGAIPGRVIKN